MCKRGKRWGPTGQKHLKVTQGKRSPSGEGKERQGEWQDCSGVGCLISTVQCQMCSGSPRKGLGSAPRVLEQGGHCDVADGLRGVLGMERKGEWGQ